MKSYSYILIIGGIIGLLASFILTVDTIKLVKNPSADLPCNINPFLNCTSVTKTWQSEIFGFPNSLLGIVAFSMLLAIGIMLYSGGQSSQSYNWASYFNPHFWLWVNLGILIAVIFVMWFFYQSVYKIGSLCLYCMTVWAVIWPLFLYTTIWNFEENHFSIESGSKKSFLFLKVKHQKIVNAVFHFISRNHFQILIAWYLIIIFLVLFHFKDFLL